VGGKSTDFVYIRVSTTTGANACYNQRILDGSTLTGYVSCPVVADDKAYRSATNGVLVMLGQTPGSNSPNGKALISSIPLLGTTGATSEKTIGPSGNAPTNIDAAAGVYHNGICYFMNWTAHGGTIYRLQLPTNLDGDWSTAWLAPISVSGGPASGLFAGQGQWTKLQIVRNLGGASNAALVCVSSWSGATPVFRIQ
jgi:hypothetical protein